MSETRPEPLPQRFPFRFVDGVKVDADGRRGVFGLTAGGFFSTPGPWPISLVTEALAQATLLVTPEAERGGTPRLVAVHSARLLQSLGTGDRLEVAVSQVASYGGLRRFACRALRGGALVAVAELTVSG